MKRLEINRAIASAIGWMDLRIDNYGGTDLLLGTSPKEATSSLVPNFHGSLDAMHEAVATFTREEYDADEGFTYHLARIVHGEDASEVGWNFYELQEATAAQRAEAFLRTKQLWKT